MRSTPQAVSHFRARPRQQKSPALAGLCRAPAMSEPSTARGGPARLAGLSALGAAVCALMVPAAHAQATTQTFAYTGAEQTFTVPAGVSSVHVAAVGGSGGNTDRPGGVAAQVSGDLSVTPGETLYVEVGARGGESAGYSSGTFNGVGEGAGGGGGA